LELRDIYGLAESTDSDIDGSIDKALEYLRER
jgi:hypothetical protein